MVRIPPAVYEHHLIRGFPHLSGCVSYNDARIPLPVAPSIAAEVNAFCAAALLLHPSPELEREIQGFKRVVALMADCRYTSGPAACARRPLTAGFATSTESARAAYELLSTFGEFSSEVHARLDRIDEALGRIAAQTLALVRDAAAAAAATATSGNAAPKGVPLDDARCYSYLCAPGQTCYAPRCPRGRGHPTLPCMPSNAP